MESGHSPLCLYASLPFSTSPDPRFTMSASLCVKKGHFFATRYCLCRDSVPMLCEQCYDAEHRGHPWLCICTRGEKRVMYSRREKIVRVKEVIEKLKSSAARDITSARATILQTQNEMWTAVSTEFQMMLNKLDEIERVISGLIEGLLELQMADLRGEASNIYQELCVKKDVPLEDEKFSCVQFALDCPVESVQRTTKGWVKQLASLRKRIPMSLDHEAQVRSICSGCERKPNALGFFMNRSIKLPCGHYFHNKDCLTSYLVNASYGCFYSKPIYRCPECWSILNAVNLLPDLERKLGRPKQHCCKCKGKGELYKRKQPGHYLCEVCADQGGLVDCRPCACTGASIYSESRTSSFGQ